MYFGFHIYDMETNVHMVWKYLRKIIEIRDDWHKKIKKKKKRKINISDILKQMIETK